jgi:hypothetical protein
MSTKDTNLSSIWKFNGEIFTNCMDLLTKIQTWPVIDAATFKMRTVSSTHILKVHSNLKISVHKIPIILHIHKIRLFQEKQIILILPINSL